ncbi:hypothetical protein [Methylobacterium sp. CM6257]
MPNYADNRLTLTGPADEIARFVRECIRVRRDDGPDDAPSLDLDALVPMPPEILATCDGATDELRAIARAATGFESWYDWSCRNWGTKWNVTEFRGRLIGDMIYDCSFLTAWSCPTAAVRALAKRYPLLRGAVVASDAAMDWCVVAAFRQGEYVEAGGAFDPQCQLLISSGYCPDPIAARSAEALLLISDDEALLTAPDPADRLWTRAALAIRHFGQLVGGDLPRHLTFERTVSAVCDLLDAGSKEAVLDSDLARAAESQEDVEFLLSFDRARTEIDRGLLRVLARYLRDDAVWADGESNDFRDWVEYELLDSCEAEALHDWACLAMYRPDTLLDWTSDEALREGFLTYADHLRRDVLDHLRCSAAGDGGQLPAAA